MMKLRRALSTSRGLRRFRRNRMAVVGLFFVLLVIITAAFAPLVAPYNPLTMNFDELLAPPPAAT